MEQELRFGKFTDDEVERILTNGLLLHEQEILKHGLHFLDLTFQEYFFCKDQSILDEEESKIKMLELATHPLIQRVTDKLSKATPEQKTMYHKFNLIVLNIMFLNTKFLIEIGQEQEAIEGYEIILKNNDELRSRFLQQFPEDKLGESFMRMKTELEGLKQAEGRLVWNGKSNELKKISEKLAIENVIEHVHDFSNVFERQKKCIIKKVKIDFFVILLYKLVFETEPKNELIVIKETSTNWGAIGAAENYFWYNSKSGAKRIYFRKRMANILKDSVKHKEIEAEVKIFLVDLL